MSIPAPENHLDCGDASPLSTARLVSPPTPPSLPKPLRADASARPERSRDSALQSFAPRDWPHAPVHRLSEQGTYMVTAGTLHKARLLNSPDRLTLVRNTLFAVAEEFGWDLQAWAILSNHYHFVAHSPDDSSTLRRLVAKLHMTTARALNQADHTEGRRVWFQYRDTRLTFESSLFARLRYVHDNPVHHGVVRRAEDYAWCSAAWWARQATPAARETLARFKTDRLTVQDNY